MTKRYEFSVNVLTKQMLLLVVFYLFFIFIGEFLSSELCISYQWALQRYHIILVDMTFIFTSENNTGIHLCFKLEYFCHLVLFQ